MSSLQELLEKSTSQHSHLCPRQVLGARLGLAGLAALGFDRPPDNKRLLVICETDGCFVDGLIAATECTVGHRRLWVEDYGKTAAVFVDTLSGQAVRVAPAPGIREKAHQYASGQPNDYDVQLQAYQVMPNSEMFSIQPVRLEISVDVILSQPGLRVICEICGEEIMNEREVRQDGHILCRACHGGAYYEFL